MSLRSHEEYENSWNSQIISSPRFVIPAEAGIKGIYRQIRLDTRFRGYDGAPEASSSLRSSSPHSYFRTMRELHESFGNHNFSDLRVLRVFVVNVNLYYDRLLPGRQRGLHHTDRRAAQCR